VAQTSGVKADSKYLKYVPFTDKDYNLFLLMHLALNAVSKARHYEVMRLGLTHTEFLLLVTVHGMDGSTTPAEISRWMMRKPPTISGLLNRMERNGLVRRRSDAKNKKQRRVVMTKKGKELFRLAQEQNALHTIMGSMSDEGFEQLWTLLEELNDTALSLTEKLKDAVPSPA